MGIIKHVTLAGILLSLLALGIWFATHTKTLIRQKTIHTANFGTLSVAYPLFGKREQVLVFVDTKKFQPGANNVSIDNG